MKLVTFQRKSGGTEEVGILTPEASIVPVKEAGFAYDSMNDLILHASDTELNAMRQVGGPGIAYDDVILLSPIPCPLQDIVCLGMNYTEHAKEAVLYSADAFSSEKNHAVFFSKRVSHSQGHHAVIPLHADLTDAVDYEAELAVILSKDAKNVQEQDVPQYIFGYTILNDVSARDLQTRHKQWYFAKSLDGFAPMGPCIVTADAFDYPPALRITTHVNGSLRQDSNTGMLLHGITEIICTLSRGMELKAGTIIATGTPKGVIMGMENPQFLKAGDVVTCAVEGIGELTNRMA